MKTLLRMFFAAMLVAACIASESLGSDFLGFGGDGWYTWRVDSADGLEIHALIKSGRPDELIIPSLQCSRKALPDSSDLGIVPADESIAWLQRLVSPRSRISSGAMAAISAHDGALAIETLTDIVRADESRKNREEALFWLAQSESDAAFDFLDRLLSAEH